MTTTVATRRSVLSGLAVSALALAAMASFILISVSGGAGAQTAQTRVDALDDLPTPDCGQTGQPDCTTAELVLFSTYSSRGTNDPDPDAGYRFYGDGAANIVYRGVQNLGVPSGPLSPAASLTAAGSDDRNVDLVPTSQLYATVVNEDGASGLDPEDRPQNAIAPDSDVIGILVYDEDAAVPQTVTINSMSSGVSRLPADFTAEMGGNIFITALAEDSNGDLILPIRDEGVAGITDDLTFFGEENGVRMDITRNVNPNIINRGNPDNGTDAVISYLSSRAFTNVEIRWNTTSADNYVVAEVDGNSTSSSERLYLRLNETSRGSDLYVGEVQFKSSEPDDNRNAYLNLINNQESSTTNVLVADDEGDPTAIVGQAGARVRAVFIADDRDNITVRFRDKTGVTSGNNPTDVIATRQASVTIETDAPAVTVTAPEHEFATANRQINFSGTAADADSGLDVSSLRLAITNPQTGGAAAQDAIINPATDIDADGYFEEALNAEVSLAAAQRILEGSEDADEGLYASGTSYQDGASRVDWRYVPDRDHRFANSIDDNALDNEMTFSLVVYDVAGNVGFSDSEEGNEVGGNNDFRDDIEPHTINLDGSPPELVDPDTTSFNEIRYGGTSDVVVYGASQTGLLWDAGSRDLVVARNAIAVVFNDGVADPAPVDFTVNWDDNTFAPILQNVVIPPDDADVDRLNMNGGSERISSGDRERIQELLGRTVFLVFSEDIPSSETPRVSVSGVMDPAGNRIATNANVVAQDGLGPGVTELVLSGGSGSGSDENRQGPGTLTNNEINIEILVNEQGPNPRVSFFDSDGTQYGSAGRTRPSGDNRWEFLFQRTRQNAQDGVVCVVVSVMDDSRNETTEGVPGSSEEDCDDNSNAIFFTLDTQPPRFDVAMGSRYMHPDVFTQRPNIQIPLDLPIDTAQDVNLRLDGEDVENEDTNLRTSDNRRFFYQPEADLDFGAHTVAIQATDFAGNESAFIDFEIQISARSDFEIALNSGWNLISFPSNPINPRVSAVFSDTNITAISTFDAANFRAGNQMATRSRVTGQFSGNLSEIRTGLAYWVFSDGVADVAVRLQGPRAGSQDLVPTAVTIPTVGGVNLVGVVDPSLRNTQGTASLTGNDSIVQRGTGAAATNVTVGDYLDNVSQSRVQRFDSTTGTFVDLADSADLRIGVGLVVYINPDITGRTPAIIP